MTLSSLYEAIWINSEQPYWCEAWADMTDLRQSFEKTKTLARAPWWYQLLHKPTRTLLGTVALRLRAFLPFTIPVHARTFFQERLSVVLPEESACHLFQDGAIEEDVTSFLLAYLAEGMTFIDVGANLGYFTLLAARLVGPSGTVHAFEPARGTYELLAHNSREHANVTVRRQALWSERTTLTFHDYGPQYSAVNSLRQHRLIAEGRIRRRQAYDVECLSLDEYCTALRLVPDFIKIDAETAESEILRGSARLIARHAPIISLEAWDDEARKSREDVAFLLAHGYTVFEYRGGEIVPHCLRDRYTYTNLLFLPPQDTKACLRPR